MKSVLVFGASNSSNSINKKFAEFAASKLTGVEIQVLDLNDFEMPIYSIDRENSGGVPSLANQFVELLNTADGIIISFAEHNGSYSVAFKNILDWISRTGTKPWSEKKLLLLATSPGQRGGQGVLSAAETSFPHFGAQVVASFSLPAFQKNFSSSEGILQEDLKNTFESAVDDFQKAIK